MKRRNNFTNNLFDTDETRHLDRYKTNGKNRRSVIQAIVPTIHWRTMAELSFCT